MKKREQRKHKRRREEGSDEADGRRKGAGKGKIGRKGRTRNPI